MSYDVCHRPPLIMCLEPLRMWPMLRGQIFTTYLKSMIVVCLFTLQLLWLYSVSPKNDTALACYKFLVHQSTTVLFAFQQHSSCMHQSMVCTALFNSCCPNLLTELWLPTGQSWTHLITRFRESIPAWVCVLVNKIEVIKQRLVELWKCSNTTFEWKRCDFRVSGFARKH